MPVIIVSLMCHTCVGCVVVSTHLFCPCNTHFELFVVSQLIEYIVHSIQCIYSVLTCHYSVWELATLVCGNLPLHSKSCVKTHTYESRKPTPMSTGIGIGRCRCRLLKKTLEQPMLFSNLSKNFEQANPISKRSFCLKMA